ncbi:hypothetical protein ACU63Y_05670 [Klebsiella aerogenes]
MTDITDIGMTIVSKGARAIRRAISIPAPLPGLEYLNFFCNNPDSPDSKRNLTRNLIRGKKPGVIVGAPQLNDRSVTCHSLVNYIDSGVTQTESMTLIAIAKAPAVAAESAVLSNFNGPKPGGGTSQGTGIMFRPDNFYYNNAVKKSDGALDLVIMGMAYKAGEWAIAEARSSPDINGGGVWLTQNGSLSSKSWNLPQGGSISTGGNIMIGSLGGSLGGVNGMPSEIAAAAIFSRALTTDEIVAFRSWMKSILQYQYGWTL